MGDLSKNFNRSEFVCNHCGELKLDPALLESMQALRDLAEKSIRITSAYRCPEHNKAIGGARKSLHITGKAADLVIKGMTIKEMFDHVIQIQAFADGGIGVYSGFVHVDTRGRKARWGRIGGKYVNWSKAVNHFDL